MSEITLIEKIKKEAAVQIAEIKSTETKEVEAIERETEVKVAELKKTAASVLEKKVSHLKLVAVSKAQQAGKILVQKAKREGVDLVFSEVEAEICALPTDDYVAFFKNKVEQTLPSKVTVSKVSAPEGKLEETKKLLSELDLSTEVVGDKDLNAGLVIYTNEGVFDVRLSRLLSEDKAELEMSIVNKVIA